MEVFSLKVRIESLLQNLYLNPRPAENDEIYLESRSSELLLRNGISDTSKVKQLMVENFYCAQTSWYHVCCRCLAFQQVCATAMCSPRWVSSSDFYFALTWPKVVALQTPFKLCRLQLSQLCFLCDDTRKRLTPCVNARTWKGGPTGISLATRWRTVGATNSLNGNKLDSDCFQIVSHRNSDVLDNFP